MKIIPLALFVSCFCLQFSSPCFISISFNSAKASQSLSESILKKNRLTLRAMSYYRNGDYRTLLSFSKKYINRRGWKAESYFFQAIASLHLKGMESAVELNLKSFGIRKSESSKKLGILLAGSYLIITKLNSEIMYPIAINLRI